MLSALQERVHEPVGHRPVQASIRYGLCPTPQASHLAMAHGWVSEEMSRTSSALKPWNSVEDVPHELRSGHSEFSIREDAALANAEIARM